ncbi:MAG: hypothetical protein Q8K45_13075 [Rubrivivax sp.]|nr:hypothetical protein [Rubrivivax sp.]
MTRGWPMALLLGAGMAQAAALRSEALDDFRDAAAWQASASDQVRARLRRDIDGSLCLDYDFAGVSGYAVMRRALPMDWPTRFDLTARLKGSGATNDLQFKLVDASGDNVWWVNRPNTVLPAALTETKFRSRHIQFAWGPAADKSLRRTQFVEFVIAAGKQGGKGALCVAKLALRERAPDPQPWPEARVTSAPGGTHFDFGLVREFNGVALQWPAGAKALNYDLQASDDGRAWRTLRRVRGSDGGLDALFLPESEARHLRVALHRGSARPQLTLKSATDWPDFNRVLATLAADAPRGELPRAFLGQQNYWTLVGVNGGGQRSALLSEDGALEVGRGGWSLEPAVMLEDGTRATWADVKITHTLREGRLPLPAVQWTHPAFTLGVEAAADGPRDGPQLLGRYTLHNRSTRTQRLTLQLALRPWQVNPPQQFLSTQGGASPVQTLRWDAQGLVVDHRPALRFTALPQTVGALPFDGGLSLAALQSAQRPAGTKLTLHDPQSHASALLQWSFTLAPSASHTVGLVAPLGATPATAATPEQLRTRFDAAAAHWRERLSRVTLQLPGDGARIADTLATSLAHMLMSRDGPALRPGTRSYARTWIRDGAMMVAGLLRLGEVDAAREFTDWYAGFVFDSGKVPCCVDQRGADPVVENDSHGQYLYAVAEVLRHTGDAAWAARHWPTVQRVTAWMEALRQSERTAANRTPERAHFFGLMPPSISHEGYSDKAAYSNWDNFWALRGYKDAVQLAQRGGHAAEATRWAGWRDEFERELAASVEATAQRWAIPYIAGAADRGDFDATSTTMALNPAQAAVSRTRLDATFERYWQEMNARTEGMRTGQRSYKDYTPYELRTVGALARLGQPARAHAMLDFFFQDQRPAGWNQWAEVVLPDAREVRFLGDMPHAWVSSDYIRSALDLLAYDDEREHALVLGAGLKAAWLAQGDVVLRGLSTAYGRLDWSLTRTASGWQLNLPSKLSGLHGGARLRWPEGLALPRAVHGGQTLAWQGRELALPAAPVQVELVRE